jgi:glutamate N-acetyltransferase / amino-acid N-acetyltransferase
MTDWQSIAGGITAPKGYLAAGIAAGLKPSGAPDLTLILSEVEAIAAGVFTTSQVKAACVDYCRQRLQAKPAARAILCNAGQANAATGAQGWADALESAQLLADALKISPELVLVASTGVIGQRIKMEGLRSNIPNLVAAASPDGSDSAARAIITTDLVPKSIALETTLDGRPVRIGGICKGRHDSSQHGDSPSVHHLRCGGVF